MSEQDNSELEAEFKKVYDEHSDAIYEQLKIASNALAKAENLAEEYGIPFDASVSPLGQTYIPDSFYEKYSELDSEVIEEIAGVYLDPDLGSGWEHSAVC